MAGVQSRKALSPFSASSIQQKPLFANRGPSKVSELPKLQAILESSLDGEPLISAKHAAETSTVVIKSKASGLSTVRQMTLFLEIPAQRTAHEEDNKEEDDEEEYGELSAGPLSAKISSCSCQLSEAESIAPKRSAAFSEANREDSGFWAEVGVETTGFRCPSFLAVHEESDSEWDVGSDDEEEEEETLLPWDL